MTTNNERIQQYAFVMTLTGAYSEGDLTLAQVSEFNRELTALVVRMLPQLVFSSAPIVISEIRLPIEGDRNDDKS